MQSACVVAPVFVFQCLNLDKVQLIRSVNFVCRQHVT